MQQPIVGVTMEYAIVLGWLVFAILYAILINWWENQRGNDTWAMVVFGSVLVAAGIAVWVEYVNEGQIRDTQQLIFIMAGAYTVFGLPQIAGAIRRSQLLGDEPTPRAREIAESALRRSE